MSGTRHCDGSTKLAGWRRWSRAARRAPRDAGDVRVVEVTVSTVVEEPRPVVWGELEKIEIDSS